MEEYKVLIVGNAGVGKTATITQFVQGNFVDTYTQTTQEQTYQKQVTVDGAQYKLEIVDTPGSQQLTLRDLYSTGQGFLVLYSITNKESFNDVGDITDTILRAKGADYVPMVIAGNKSDLEQQRKVETASGQTLATNTKSPFYETSAKSNVNVDEIFSDLVREIKASLISAEITKKKKTAGKCVII